LATFDELNKINFVWDQLEEKWMQKFNDLKNIYKKNGESSNSVKIPSDLSRWTSK